MSSPTRQSITSFAQPVRFACAAVEELSMLGDPRAGVDGARAVMRDAEPVRRIAGQTGSADERHA
jgi:hypothetical protein